MKKRALLPSVETLYERYVPDFEKGDLYHRKGRYVGKKLGGSLINGYLYVGNVKEGRYAAHRILWKMFYKQEPPDIIDHIDSNRLNNSIRNLQKTNRRTNMVKSPYVRNRTGYRGVYYIHRSRAYQVRVYCSKIKKGLFVGMYENLEEAAQAYNLALDKLGIDDAYRNFTPFPEEKVDLNKTFFKVGGVS